uniref:Solute carrier family 2 member 11 n=1 Tax=Molossus molossus TaxID=27622 RepID=A0A7J8BZS1_MOLMO|nr:solute carrier family 2 member 11 [Molossus molossus]
MHQGRTFFQACVLIPSSHLPVIRNTHGSLTGMEGGDGSPSCRSSSSGQGDSDSHYAGRELLGGPQAWPLLLASCLVPGVPQLASLPLLPESPRYLLIDRGDTEGCLKGPASPSQWELFQDGTPRRQVMSLLVLSSAMELCGNNSMHAYASSVFRGAGVPQEKVQDAIIRTGAASCSQPLSVT